MISFLRLDFKVDKGVFENELENSINRHASYPDDISFEITEASTSSSNSKMYLLTMDDQNANTHIKIVSVREPDNSMRFTDTIKLKNYNNSFIISDDYNNNHDLENVLLNALLSCCKNDKNGILVSIFNNDQFVLKEGKDLSKGSKLAVVDKKGNVYTDSDEENVTVDDDISGHVPTYLINDWLEENTAFKEKLNGISQKDQLELMAQFAIYQKRKEMISFSQFRDIFIQIGSFIDIVGGFKDESMNNIYSIIS